MHSGILRLLEPDKTVGLSRLPGSPSCPNTRSEQDYQANRNENCMARGSVCTLVI